MDVASHKRPVTQSVAGFGDGGQGAGGSYLIRLGDRDGHFVRPEVGVKLRMGVILMGIPAFILPLPLADHFVSRQFRKPLPGHDKIVVKTHTGKHFRQLDAKLDIQLQRLSRIYRFRQADPGQRAIVFISVVGLYIFHRREQIGAIRQAQGRDVHPAGEIADPFGPDATCRPIRVKKWILRQRRWGTGGDTVPVPPSGRDVSRRSVPSR